MDEDMASKFVSSLVKSIQSLCNGYIDFTSSIEVIGHIHVNIDHSLKFNYVLSEEVNKSPDETATVFSSHSYHSKPPPSATPTRPVPSQVDTRDRSRHKSRLDDNDTRVSAIQPSFSPASRDSLTSRSDDDSLQAAASRLREGESARSPASQTRDTLDRRRTRCETQNARPTEPALKRIRLSDSGSVTIPKPEEVEVIEVKEEPDDEQGSCISQPDFSNLMAESLDRVGQTEGTSMLAGVNTHGPQPFPVTLHHNQSTVQVPSTIIDPSDPQASTSGGILGLQFDDWTQHGHVPAKILTSRGQGTCAMCAQNLRRTAAGCEQLSEPDYGTDHRPSKITTRRGMRNCILCAKKGRVTSEGNKIQTTFECVTCAVALCKRFGCFHEFHDKKSRAAEPSVSYMIEQINMRLRGESKPACDDESE